MLTESQQDAVNVVLRFYEAFNSRDAETLHDVLAEEHTDYTYFGRDQVSPEAIGRMLNGFWQAFPDWHETIDEIVPGDDGYIVVRATGRGTQDGEFMGRSATGNQIAVPLINILRIHDSKITEYRSTFPFTLPDEETINAADDVQAARAEQGGFRVAETGWNALLRDYADERIDSTEALMQQRAGLAQEPARCQALLQDTLRRCQNAAAEGSLYCPIHETAGYGM